jgi:hypothetical protein
MVANAALVLLVYAIRAIDLLLSFLLGEEVLQVCSASGAPRASKWMSE